MPKLTEIGYAGEILRVDLSANKTWTEQLDESTVKKWIGGVALGTKFLYDEVPPEVQWYDPENILIITTGPLAGNDVPGAGTINIMAKGPMTNLAGSSQANGFFGAYLKFCGFDGIIIKGKSNDLVYLMVKDEKAEIIDAKHLSGKTVLETEKQLKHELGVNRYGCSVYCIGPAGENKVLYACIIGDGGHAAGHNGLGAVMGSKNLKAIVAFKSVKNFKVFDPVGLKEKAKKMVDSAKKSIRYKWGTGGSFSALHEKGSLPVRNYTTNIFPEHEKMNGQYLRTHFKIRSRPCYKCSIAHVKEVTVTEGPYAGHVGEEPDYELMAGFGPQIGNTDLGAVVMLANEADGLGMEANETCWTIGWAMECFEKGVFSTNETDGLDLTWGNVESVKILMNRIARRQGHFANLLAEGVMRASKKIGGKASDWAIYSQKGSSPRGHDHRGKWFELFDTCMTNTSTLESVTGPIQPHLVEMKSPDNHFSHEQVSTFNAKHNGIGLFYDCLGICRFVGEAPKLLIPCVNAVTGWNLTLKDAFTIGLRAVNLLRLFNIRHGLDIKNEIPSTRYGSIPVDGPNKGTNIMEKWDLMVKNYYLLMGWNPDTGIPLPETLKKLGLEYTLV
jgi:aldehyde:ferredoxin oxidoreductase